VILLEQGRLQAIFYIFHHHASGTVFIRQNFGSKTLFIVFRKKTKCCGDTASIIQEDKNDHTLIKIVLNADVGI